MRYVADLHLHSHFSRATSRDLDLEHLSYWAQLKGVRVVGTADFTHPGWFRELQEKLVEAEPGLFRLRPDLGRDGDREVPARCRSEVRFLLTVEISSIYKKGDRTRKVHNVVLVPSFPAAARLAASLARIGNLASDGRPILGLDCRSLLEMVLQSDPQAFLVPAHIWTPHFAVLGAASGFDSLEECFGDLTPHLFAVETGLSSDPPMNWRLSALDRYTLVSNSDAHSPSKLMREANIFDTELSFNGIREAWRTAESGRCLGTIEFFPEEGKYHWDGHRACQQRLTPAQTRSAGGLCPACGKKVTVGVLHRVESLADRPEGFRRPHAGPYRSLVPLPEILSEILEQGEESKRVQAEYFRLLARFGPELDILTEVPEEDLARFSSPLLGRAVRCMRAGDVLTEPGYDGVYGRIRTLRDGERAGSRGQVDLFGGGTARPSPLLEGLNPAQREAVEAPEGPLLLVAGAGTGKTNTLARRIAYLITERGLPPAQVLAVTFTRKAAAEIRERLEGLLGGRRQVHSAALGTIHGISARFLRHFAPAMGLAADFPIADETLQLAIAREILPSTPDTHSALQPARLVEQIASSKARSLGEQAAPQAGARAERPPETVPGLAPGLFAAYQAALTRRGALDFEDLVLQCIRLFRHPGAGPAARGRYASVLVDEAQDLNEAQYEWLRALTADHRRLALVGDPDQSIYSFRGANARIFQRFLEDHPGAARIHLEENYRCPPTVLAAAEPLIAASPGRLAKRLYTRRSSGRKVQIWNCDYGRSEAARVVQAIEETIGQTSMERRDARGPDPALSGAARSFSDIAILTRTHAQHLTFAEALGRAGIPFQAAAATRKKPRPEILDALARLRAAASPADNEALSALLLARVPGIGEKTARSLRDTASQHQRTLLDFLSASHLPSLSSPSSWTALQAVLDDLRRLREGLEQRGLPLTLRGLFDETGLLEPPPGDPDAAFLLLLAAQYPPGVHGPAAPVASPSDRPAASEPDPGCLAAEPLARSVVVQARSDAGAPSFGPAPGECAGHVALQDVHSFLAEAALRLESDLLDPRAESVKLLTIHAAKGMEFPVVFLCGLEEGLLPHAEATASEEAIEEERRLCYVAMTRASELLVLTHCRSRLLFGSEKPASPSRFLDSLPVQQFESRRFESRSSRRRQADRDQLRLFE
ncbi:MAG: UvrD-helicase domain-containing protein [Planctomycetes bacterium]|nr:UvrD-helicase domain-containing protein [Planctomycetota bacterium]